MVYRPVRWIHFYDNDGRPIKRLVRRLTKIRRGGARSSPMASTISTTILLRPTPNACWRFRGNWRDIQFSCGQLHRSTADHELCFSVRAIMSADRRYAESEQRGGRSGATIAVPSNYGHLDGWRVMLFRCEDVSPIHSIFIFST
jgi:hypothetical protein